MITSSKGKFILSVGDDGAVLTYCYRSKLRKRLYAPSPSSDEVEEFKKLFNSDKTAPISILVDIHDQSYVQHNIPNVSSIAINNIIKRRLEKDFTADDIKAAIRMDRIKTGRKDWVYLFVSIRNSPPFSEWLDLVVELPNRFSGIFMLPIEVDSLVKDLEKSLESEKKRKGCEWKILVVHNRVGGLRQIVFKNNKIVITRMNQPVGVATPDVIAGNIEQDLQNTIEFIRRMGYDDKEGLDVYTIVSEEIKRELHSDKIPSENFFALTPSEVSQKLKMFGVAQDQDKFCDVIIAMLFALKKKPVVKLHTNYTSKLDQLYNLDKAVIITGIVLSLLTLCFLVFSVIKIISFSKDISLAQKSRMDNKDKMGALQNDTKKLPYEVGKVVDSIYFDDFFMKNSFRVLDFSDKFISIKPDLSSVTTFRISTVSPQNKSNNFISGSFSIDLKNPGRRIEQMIDISEQFRKKVNDNFKEYEIKLTNFPGKENISTGIMDGQTQSESSSVNVQVLIEGPK